VGQRDRQGQQERKASGAVCQAGLLKTCVLRHSGAIQAWCSLLGYWSGTCDAPAGMVLLRQQHTERPSHKLVHVVRLTSRHAVLLPPSTTLEAVPSGSSSTTPCPLGSPAATPQPDTSTPAAASSCCSMAAYESLPNLHTKRVRGAEGPPWERRAAATAWLAPCGSSRQGMRALACLPSSARQVCLDNASSAGRAPQASEQAHRTPGPVVAAGDGTLQKMLQDADEHLAPVSTPTLASLAETLPRAAPCPPLRCLLRAWLRWWSPRGLAGGARAR
jgi:hypothetical protein